MLFSSKPKGKRVQNDMNIVYEYNIYIYKYNTHGDQSVGPEGTNTQVSYITSIILVKRD